MIKMTNRHLLLALSGLGLLNVVLCLVIVLRENTNGTRITQLASELQVARAELQTQSQGLNTDLQKTRDELALTARTLTETRASLGQTAQQLTSARSDLDQARAALTVYQGKPWLNQSGKQEPWQSQFQDLMDRLAGVEKALKETKPMPPKE